MKKIAYIEDNIVPQMFTTAIEAYKFSHRSTLRSKGFDQLETFGLLWGYSIPAKGTLPAKVIATMATVETSAVRHNEWVAPNFDSLRSKKEFFEHYWPNIELVGTFHSHPYKNLSEVNDNKGWKASEGDQEFWPHFHEEVAPEQPLLAHLIVTVANLEKTGWAIPDRLKGSESSKGYVLSAKSIKLWLRSYASSILEQENGITYEYSDDMGLEIPSLERRFL
ncbi:hypothetical protein ACIGG6_05135 [Vreelandella lionensis]|jgi:hypothetical protein|uniref:JAB domain-containing protein n=1 Tax=Vreelandella lionensis TaxID=1144478 RepID=A0ABW8BR10_9GAMM